MLMCIIYKPLGAGEEKLMESNVLLKLSWMKLSYKILVLWGLDVFVEGG